ncbi:MAG: class I SAM-dependent methyltransferase [Syntrophomonas sp.]
MKYINITIGMELKIVKIEEIRKMWVTQSRDVQNEVQLWDSQSEDPTYHHMYDEFLKLLEREHMLDKSYDVLDIGCGVGVYSIALADRVNTVTGLDISTKMLGHGQKILKESAITNVRLETADWYMVDLEKQEMKDRFDLVFAHNTPAICDASTFEKMIEASRRFGAVCSPIKMIEPVMQKVQEMAGIGDDGSSCENHFAFMLDMLLHKDYLPKLYYEKQIWPMNQSYDDACSFYLGRAAMARQLSESETESIKDYLRSIVKDDIITDRINATVATLYWEK